jgi:hypothetical protein
MIDWLVGNRSNAEMILEDQKSSRMQRATEIRVDMQRHDLRQRPSC